MSNAKPTVKHPGLRGSEQHHDLKDPSKAKTDPGHAEGDEAASDEMKAAIDDADADEDTGIADALRDAARKDD